MFKKTYTLLFVWMLVFLLMIAPAIGFAQDGEDDPADETNTAEVTEVEATEADASEEVTVEVTDEATEEEADQPLGAGLLILFVGIGGVAAVGMAMISRDNALEDDTPNTTAY